MADLERIAQSALGAAAPAVADRMRGERPGAFRAVRTATVVGGATGAVIYKLLRR